MLIGGREFFDKTAIVKDMETREQHNVPMKGLVEGVRTVLEEQQRRKEETQ